MSHHSATIELTGPVHIEREAGPWSDTEERQMSTTLTVNNYDIDPAHFVHTGFTEDPKRIIEVVTGERNQDTEFVDSDYRPHNVGVTAENDWDIEVRVLRLENLYKYACGAALTDEFATGLESPFTVLQRWANTDRYQTEGEATPVNALTWLAEYAATENDALHDLHDAPAWDALLDVQKRR